MSKKFLLLFLLLILSLVNWSIYKKEQQLKEGKIVYLKLAPKDPRAFMLGDYMELTFMLQNKIYKALPKVDDNRWVKVVSSNDGHVVVSIASNHVATFKRVDEGNALDANELRLEYRVRHGKIKFASNRFYFQEGKAKLYDEARYGVFRVNSKGQMLLVDLLDINLSEI